MSSELLLKKNGCHKIFIYFLELTWCPNQALYDMSSLGIFICSGTCLRTLLRMKENKKEHNFEQMQYINLTSTSFKIFIMQDDCTFTIQMTKQKTDLVWLYKKRGLFFQRQCNTYCNKTCQQGRNWFADEGQQPDAD